MCLKLIFEPEKNAVIGNFDTIPITAFICIFDIRTCSYLLLTFHLPQKCEYSQSEHNYHVTQHPVYVGEHIRIISA